MEVTTNQPAYQALGAMVNGMADVQLPAASEGKDTGKFQELMEKQQSADKPDSKAPEQPAKSEKPAAQKPEKAKAKGQNQKQEDPVETAKKLQVYLTPVSPEELSQLPTEWLPQVKEGEPIVCIGVCTGENGQQVPILVGAEQAEQMYGKQAVDPRTLPSDTVPDPSDPEADAMLEATDPAVKHGPAQLLEKLADRVTGVKEEESKPEPELFQTRQADAETTVEITDAEQPPQQLFHEVEAAPIKVGETGTARETREVPDVETQVDTGLAEALARGETRVEIRLDPENLGSVKVEITRTVEGTIRVALSAENSQTRSLLEKHAVNLQNALGARTQDEVRVEVQKQAESQRQDENPYEGHNGHARQQQEQRRQEQGGNRGDFLQRLRLGLVPEEDG